MIKKYPLPPDDGAPFLCSIYDQTDLSPFLKRCENPSICGIDGRMIPKYWDQPAYLYIQQMPVTVCEQHFKWINNHHPEETE